MCSLQFHAFNTTPHVVHNLNYNLFLVLAKNLKLTTFFPIIYFSHKSSLVFFFHTQALTWTIFSTSFKFTCKLTSMFWHKTIRLGIKLWLDLSASCNQNGPHLFSNPTPCFLLPITIKCKRSTTMKIEALFDSSASTCFIDKELVQQHKLPLVKKKMSMVVEVIDNWSLSSKLMTHETKALEITIGSHISKIVFNVISSLTNPIIVGLSWLILHNLRMD